MSPVSPLFAIGALAAAVLTGWLLLRWQGAPAAGSNRYTAIEGLRGYLAFGVFLCHASIWFFFVRHGRWEVPPSALYTHLGQASVILFFMITAFLFFSRLLDARADPHVRRMDWTHLFASRVLRLVPLYVVAMGLLFGLVAASTGFELRVPVSQLLTGALQWLSFTTLGAPTLNAYADTSIVIAGVTWSLPYEWCFYLALPLMAVALGQRVPGAAWLAVGLGLLLALRLHTDLFANFGGGIVAALLVRHEATRRRLSGPLGGALVVGSLVLLVACFDTAFGGPQLLLLTVAFCAIACGHTLWGVLSHPVSRLLGQSAYSLYLLHGLLLFAAFHLVIGREAAAQLSPAAHWLIVTGLGVLLTLLCQLTFRGIEAPAMARVPALTAALRRWRGRRLPPPLPTQPDTPT